MDVCFCLSYIIINIWVIGSVIMGTSLLEMRQVLHEHLVHNGDSKLFTAAVHWPVLVIYLMLLCFCSLVHLPVSFFILEGWVCLFFREGWEVFIMVWSRKLKGINVVMICLIIASSLAFLIAEACLLWDFWEHLHIYLLLIFWGHLKYTRAVISSNFHLWLFCYSL